MDPEPYPVQPARTAVTPGRAMTESFVRTIVSQLVGLALAALATWGAKNGLDLEWVKGNEEAVFGVVWIALTGLYAAVQRRYVPIQTDVAGVARTDVTSGGKPL